MKYFPETTEELKRAFDQAAIGDAIVCDGRTFIFDAGGPSPDPEAAPAERRPAKKRASSRRATKRAPREKPMTMRPARVGARAAEESLEPKRRGRPPKPWFCLECNRDTTGSVCGSCGADRP
jgi:hypothetical protein